MRRVWVLLLLVPLVLGAADVSGKWVLQVELSAGSGSPTFTFRQDGEKITGRYSGTLGEADVTGTIRGDDIQFQFTVKGDLGELTARYTGKVSGDTMKGKADYGPAVGNGTFEGKRQK
jgi:hypothetical protein